MILPILENRYKILEDLGDGGFGKTFLAEDTHMPSGRRCVIKRLKPIANDPQVYQLVKERFGREAAILEELGNGSYQIPKLYAYFESGGLFYLVQEWIEGETLTQKVQKQGILDESTVKSILINLLVVLDYVHSKRIVHRDIKPDNIILRTCDRLPVLIDFGAVKETMGTILSSSGNSTSSVVIGTPGFMPSEQGIGRPVYGSDIYAIGLTAIFLLTGKVPQELETDPLTGEICWRRHALSVSPTLATVLDRAIQSHPRDRFPTAKAMLDALQESQFSPNLPPTILSPSSPIVQTIAVSPVNSIPTQVKSHDNNNGLSDWLKAVITGSIIGSFVLGALVFNNYLTSSSDSEESSSTNASQTTESAPQSTINTPVSEINSQVFYYVADSAFSNSDSADKQIENLKAVGYSDAGKIWIQDYPNLSGKPLFQVYPAKFSDRSSCANFLRVYSLKNSESYCFRASHNPNVSSDRFYARQEEIKESSDRPSSSSISQEEAIQLIKTWQDYKRRIFAPPYERYLGTEVLTGKAYHDNIERQDGQESSSEWVQNSSAYYTYGIQQIDSVENFFANGNQAIIEVIVTEQRTLYNRNGRIDSNASAFDQRLVRYNLELDRGQWKIADYNTIQKNWSK